MPQEWKVSKAFLSTDKETNAPQIVKTPGGNMHKYMVQVEEQPVDGWFSVLKKDGNEVKPGDVLYGDIAENNWGKPQFTRAQRPDGNYGGNQPAQSLPATSPVSKSTEEKLDYLISLVENFLGAEAVQKQGAKPSAVSSADDDEQVDLSDLEY